jgi:DNA-binding GntR family transcriptional regulator
VVRCQAYTDLALSHGEITSFTGHKNRMATTISDYIASDLAARVGARSGSAIPLTLHALSNRYGVSPTPVREALRRLLAEGVLVRLENGRIEVNPVALNTGSLRDKPESIQLPPVRANSLQVALTTEVIRKSLGGNCDYLREEATAARYGVGRTAIRQAFQRLAGQGLIVHVPRCGWRVRAFDENDLIAYLEIREVLENKALALARPHLLEADLRKMLAGNVSRSGGPRLDNSLHSYLVEKSGNEYLREFFNRHSAYYTALLEFAAPETCVVAAMARQHRKILRALIAQDWARSRRELTRHIRAQRPIVRALLQRIGRIEQNEIAVEE